MANSGKNSNVISAPNDERLSRLVTSILTFLAGIAEFRECDRSLSSQLSRLFNDCARRIVLLPEQKAPAPDSRSQRELSRKFSEAFRAPDDENASRCASLLTRLARDRLTPALHGAELRDAKIN